MKTVYFFICCAIVTHPDQWTIIELRIGLWLSKLRRGVVLITTAQLCLTKPELRFCQGSNPAHGV